jgi:hypothetical protein
VPFTVALTLYKQVSGLHPYCERDGKSVAKVLIDLLEPPFTVVSKFATSTF